MKHVKTIIALGIIVAVVPVLGFPSSWKNVIFFVLGLAIAITAFRLFAAARIAEPETSEEHEHASYQQSDLPTVDASVAHE